MMIPSQSITQLSVPSSDRDLIVLGMVDQIMTTSSTGGSLMAAIFRGQSSFLECLISNQISCHRFNGNTEHYDELMTFIIFAIVFTALMVGIFWRRTGERRSCSSETP